MRRTIVVLGTLLIGMLALVFTATQAWAHAVVISTSPSDGARLAKLPTTVTVKFDEPVGLQLGYLRVVNSSGGRVDSGSATHPAGDATSITVGLKPGSGDGTYLVSWRVISADSHPVAGSVRFVVGSGALGVVTGSSGPTVSMAVSSALASVHGLGFAGVALLGGSWLIFALWPLGRRRRVVPRVVWTGWVLASAAAVAEFLLQGPYDAGGSLSGFWHWDLLQATLHSSTGQLISVRLILLGLLAVVLSSLLVADRPIRRGWAAEAAAIIGTGVLVSYAASGHTQTASPRWFAVLVDALHLGAASVWLGGLVLLLVAAYSRPEFGAANDVDDVTELAAGLPIFSRVAMTSVATLAVTGTIQAWREVGAWDGLSSTSYGRLVLAKIVLFSGLVLLGYFARRHVQQSAAPRRESPLRLPVLVASGPGPVRRDFAALDETAPNTVHRLRQTVLAEVVAGAVVLGITGVLISQPPGKAALAAQRSKPKVVSVALTATARAIVEINPGKHGTVQIAIQLAGSATPTSVVATASLPAREIGPLAVPLQATGPDSYTAAGVLLPSAGKWQITITVQTSEFDSTTAVASVALS